jgi:PKD repeat protein
VTLTAKISHTCVAPFQVKFSASGSTGATSYAWLFDDGATSALVTVTHTYTVGGTYNVVLTVTGSGGPLSTSTKVTIPCA